MSSVCVEMDLLLREAGSTREEGQRHHEEAGGTREEGQSHHEEAGGTREEGQSHHEEVGGTREEGQSHHEEVGGTRTATSEQKRWKRADFKKRECNTFIEDSSSDGQCQCGRPRDRHPTNIKTAVDTEWTSEQHSSERHTDAFGELKFEGDRYVFRPFLRLSSDTEPSLIYDLMTRRRGQDDGWGLWTPYMVVSVVGGQGSAEVNPWVQMVIRQGLVKALEKGGNSWILTEGFDEGEGRCVGEAVKAVRDSRVVRAVGITPWGCVNNRDQLVSQNSRAQVQMVSSSSSQKDSHCSPTHPPTENFDQQVLRSAVQGGEVKYSVQNKTCCLEKNHWAFLLVDDGSEGHRGGEKNFSVKLEKHISTQHMWCRINISVLNMLISGELSMLERVDVSLKNSTPWLVLAGSGGVADLLSDLLENQSPASDGVNVTRVTELIRKHFPSEALTDQLVEQVKSIYRNRKLITFYHEEEKPEDFGRVMIKALMPASRHRASGNTFPYSKELFLTMTWNRVDFASSELFNINWNDWMCVQQDEDMKACMMFALTRDMTQFVHLFIAKKFIPTYGFLEELYSRVDKDTLVYKLLLERLKKRRGTSVDSLKEISLFEVSGVLKKLKVDVKPYFTVLGLEDFTSDKKALEHVRKPLKGERLYRNKLCKSPLTHLFIWAVLLNHSVWADFFWEQEEEDSVLNALSACKMLREMSKLDIETDTKLSELATKFEERARGVFGSCYQSDEKLSFQILSRKSPVWNTDCFQIVTVVESGLFLSHDGIQSVLSTVWWGGMKRDTTVWKVLLTMFCPLLLCTNLISYREPEEESKPSFVVSRWRQFLSAPVTSFLGNAVMYILFLFLFAYVLLVDFKPPPPSGPSISEYVLYFWVFTFFCEEIYEAFFMRDMTLPQRMKLYRQDVWNMYDLTAILLFIIGLICRMFERSYDVGRCVLSIDYMVFTLRLIHIFAVHKQMGPKIIIVGKMMKDVFSFLFFLGVWIVAYGVANQALLYSYDPNPERIIRRVFYRPYLHIYGPVDDEDVGLNCTENMTQIEGGAEPCRSEYNNWLEIILLVVFLLVTNILLINLLIAMLTKTFETVQEKSDHYWKFQHYNLIMEYQSRPVLAPPLIFLSHLLLFFSFLKKKIRREPSSRPNSGQSDDEWLNVKKWETKQKDNFLKAQSETKRSSDTERIKQISDNVDIVLMKQVTDSTDINQRNQQMTDRMEKEQQKQLKQLSEQFTVQRRDFDQRQTALETTVQNALSQILDALTKPRST